MQAIKAFVLEGSGDDLDKNPLLRLGFGFFIATQRKDGSWREFVDEQKSSLDINLVLPDVNYASLLVGILVLPQQGPGYLWYNGLYLSLSDLFSSPPQRP